jgi:hypothetical protein
MTDDERRAPEPSELEGGGTEQTWGQGEGRHEPTIPEPDDHDHDHHHDHDHDHDEEVPTSSYADGTPHALDDPDLPLAREDEGMDR